MNTEEYVHTMTWLQSLTNLLEHMQVRLLGGTQEQTVAVGVLLIPVLLGKSVRLGNAPGQLCPVTQDQTRITHNG